MVRSHDLGDRVVVVVNAGTHPELLYAARGLQNEGANVVLVSASMVPSGRATRMILKFAPQSISTQIGRRSLPPGCENVRLVSAGLLLDLAATLLSRRSAGAAAYLRSIRNFYFSWRAGRVVRQYDGQFGIVLAQESTARIAFRNAKQSLKILNYPIAHHRWMDRLMRSEAERNPEWATAAVAGLRSERYYRRLDIEIHMAEQIVVASSFVKKTFLSEGIDASRLCVVPLGGVREAPNVVAKPEHGPLRVLFAGQVVHRKGIGYLVDALNEVPEAWQLRIAGPISDALADRLVSTGEILGSVSRTEMSRHMTWADVLVLPSLAEGFGLTALEAMAHGAPAIVTTNTLGPDVISHGVDGFVVPPADSQEIARFLRMLATDRDLLRRMSSAARRTASRFDWVAYEDRISTVVLKDRV